VRAKASNSWQRRQVGHAQMQHCGRVARFYLSSATHFMGVLNLCSCWASLLRSLLCTDLGVTRASCLLSVVGLELAMIRRCTGSSVKFSGVEFVSVLGQAQDGAFSHTRSSRWHRKRRRSKELEEWAEYEGMELRMARVELCRFNPKNRNHYRQFCCVAINLHPS
jgi:hypothetical protein